VIGVTLSRNSLAEVEAMKQILGMVIDEERLRERQKEQQMKLG
jgi:hypothetical protein